MQELYKIRGIKKTPIDYTPSLTFNTSSFLSSYPDPNETRSYEIKDWLKEHPEVTHWVAVDDLDMSNHFGPISGNHIWGLDNFVHTPRSSEGIKQSGIKEKIIKFLK
jgi:hypothetical protein